MIKTCGLQEVAFNVIGGFVAGVIISANYKVIIISIANKMRVTI